MADGQKLILGVGNGFVIKDIRDYFAESAKGKIVIGEGVKDVTEAMEMIENGAYSGVLIHSLVLPNGKRADEYNELQKKFERFDNPPNIWRSTGLYVVEQAISRNLVTVVNTVAEDREVIREAERLGAKCFKCLGIDRSKNILKDNLDYFLDKLG